jgi:hypothetical protein
MPGTQALPGGACVFVIGEARSRVHAQHGILRPVSISASGRSPGVTARVRSCGQVVAANANNSSAATLSGKESARVSAPRPDDRCIGGCCSPRVFKQDDRICSSYAHLDDLIESTACCFQNSLDMSVVSFHAGMTCTCRPRPGCISSGWRMRAPPVRRDRRLH